MKTEILFACSNTGTTTAISVGTQPSAALSKCQAFVQRWYSPVQGAVPADLS